MSKSLDRIDDIFITYFISDFVSILFLSLRYSKNYKAKVKIRENN